MAEMEHDRWRDDRTARGWTTGPRDLLKKTSPFLVPWSQLDEKAREVDRNFVRSYPLYLAMMDLTLKYTSQCKGDGARLPDATWSCRLRD
jgi:hypothetical protein